jgi:hypothetical protein
MVNLKVHLHQCFLHVLNMGSGIFYQPLSLPHVGAQGGDLGLWSETAPQQAVGMQLSQPASITDIGLPAGTFLA